MATPGQLVSVEDVGLPVVRTETSSTGAMSDGVELNFTQPAPDEPASPPPAYGTGTAPLPLEMERMPTHKAFAPKATHNQLGERRIISGEEPSIVAPQEMTAPSKQISAKSEGGTRII